MPKFDVKLNAVRCVECEGTGRVLAKECEPFDFDPRGRDAPALTIIHESDGSLSVSAEGDEVTRLFVKCGHCNGLGFRHEMSMDGLNILKLVTPKVKGTATFTPPKDKPDAV